MTNDRKDLPKWTPGWWRRYQAYNDAFLEMLDALDAGVEPAPMWQETAFRRRLVTKAKSHSHIGRRQLRDFTRRYRGWRGRAVIVAVIVVNCIIGFLIGHGSAAPFGVVEAIALVNLGVLGLTFAFIGVWFNPGSLGRFGGRRFLLLPVLIFLGALGGGLCMALVSGISPATALGKSAVAGLILACALTIVLAVIVGVRNRELAAINAQLAAEADQQRLAREVAASRLRLLRAQIEPHFLFNTLGAVQQLAEERAPEAAALTANLIRFLRNAVHGFDDRTTTLGDEAAVIESYLQIMQSRLGARLTYAIDIPAALRQFPIQPTILLTFVENAIKHGIEGSSHGGSIAVSASVVDALLCVEIADTGVGLGDAIGDGHGWRNVKEQLALAYGGRATLEFVENEPSGLIVRLQVPRDDTAEAHP
jgi:hypothetical protein